ncbi:unnamed protein product, partial [Symbiodinium sp. KB8]
MAAAPRSITLVQLRDRLLGSAKSDMARLVCAALLEGLSLGPQGCARVMNGEFAKMLRPAAFRHALYEGLDERDRAVLPQSLSVSEALATWPPERPDLAADSSFPDMVGEIATAVVARAQKVLGSVVAKGAAMGERMDAKTQTALWPAVLREALAFELKASVSGIVRQSVAVRRLSQARIASPDGQGHDWEQLTEEALAVAAEGEPGSSAVVEEFMGSTDGLAGAGGDAALPTWEGAVGRDARREGAAASSRGAKAAPPGGVGAQMGPVEEVETRAPALGELMRRLRALPHEVNRELVLDGPDARPGARPLLQLLPGCCGVVAGLPGADGSGAWRRVELPAEYAAGALLGTPLVAAVYACGSTEARVGNPAPAAAAKVEEEAAGVAGGLVRLEPGSLGVFRLGGPRRHLELRAAVPDGAGAGPAGRDEDGVCVVALLVTQPSRADLPAA